MAVLDKKICEALSFADEVVDAKKDDTIEAVVSVKKAINTLGPVQSVVVRIRRFGGADHGIAVLVAHIISIGVSSIGRLCSPGKCFCLVFFFLVFVSRSRYSLPHGYIQGHPPMFL